MAFLRLRLQKMWRDTRRDSICWFTYLVVQQPELSKSEACSKELLPGLHVDAGSQDFGPPSTVFLAAKKGARWEVEYLGCELAAIWDAGTFKVRI